MTKQEFDNLKTLEAVYCNKNIKNGPQKNWIGIITHKCSKDLVVLWDSEVEPNGYFTYDAFDLRKNTFFASENEGKFRVVQQYGMVDKKFLTIECLSLKKTKEQLEFEF
jgi:hypothetical protein